MSAPWRWCARRFGAIGGSIPPQRAVTKVTSEMLALCWRVGTINITEARGSR